MKTWEYKSEQIPPELAVERLNALGREGWEVIQMTWIPPFHESDDYLRSIDLTKWATGTNVWLVFLKRGGR